jgi:hypothetical protein
MQIFEGKFHLKNENRVEGGRLQFSASAIVGIS